MVEKYSVPEVYKKMNQKGFLAGDSYLWLNEMEWMSPEKITAYEYEDGERKDIVPFAFTGAGDKWVWVLNETGDYPVGLCECAEVNGIYYAKNTEDAILRQIIEYTGGAYFYNSLKEAKSYQISEKELIALLQKWADAFRGILCETYIDIIDTLSKMHLKRIQSRYGEWYALLSEDEVSEMIHKYLDFEQMDEEFEWFIQ